MAASREVLPTDVTPVHYMLTVIPDFSSFTFECKAVVDCTVKTPTQSVTVNALELDVLSVSCTQDGAAVGIKGYVLDTTAETLIIAFENVLQQGPCQITFEVKGVMNDKLKGFYRSKAKLADGSVSFIGCTQFEATSARLAFPCWDEPAHKATFSADFIVDSHLSVLSNMPEHTNKVIIADGPSKRLVKFSATPVMSTYLLAWVIGNFEYVSTTVNKSISGTPTCIRAFCLAGHAHEMLFALDVAARCLPLYEEYFGIDYPLPKSDLIAIPDFSAGAMENWGLVTYREQRVFCTQESSIRQKQGCAMVVAHELAHMWFGNLVTMSWWEELWLNEGFARFMQYFSVDILFPEWKMFDCFVNDVNAQALSLDSLLNSHPIEVPIKNAREVDEVFDAISYSKGGCVLRMLHGYIGASAFQESLSRYLKKFSYQNATTLDLWASLEEVTGKPVASVMHHWTRSQGFPLIRVTRQAGGIKLQQNRFLSSRPATAEEDQIIWSIPLKIEVGGGETLDVLFDTRETTIEIKGTPKYVLVNAGGLAVARVVYDESLIAELSQNVSQLSNCDRLSLLADALAACVAGVQRSRAVLSLLEGYSAEADANVWSQIAGVLSKLKVLSDGAGQETKTRFASLACRICQPALDRAGWEATKGEDPYLAVIRSSAVGVLCSLGRPQHVEGVKKLIEKFFNTGDISQDLMDIIFTAHVRFGDESAFNAVKGVYKTHSNIAIATAALSALGATRVPEIYDGILDFVLADVRSQDLPRALAPYSGNTVMEGGKKMAKYMRENFEHIFNVCGGGGFVFTNMIAIAFRNLKTSDQIAETKEWWANVDPLKKDTCSRGFNQALEAAETVIKWAAAEEADFSAWLSENIALE